MRTSVALLTEFDREACEKTAKKIVRAVSGLDSMTQGERVKSELEKIEDHGTRCAVQSLVWVYLRNGKKTAAWLDFLLSTNGFLLCTFVVVFFVSFLGLKVSFVWSIFSAFIVMGVLRFIFRTFDREFMFRRLFVSCVATGLVLIGPAQFAFSFQTPWGPVSWGGAPANSLILVWLFATALSAFAAYFESRE